MKSDSQIRELDAAEAMARRNARSARMGFYAQSNGFRMMSDLEQTRLARSHAQRIGNMESKIGGSGAMAGEGTTWAESPLLNLIKFGIYLIHFYSTTPSIEKTIRYEFSNSNISRPFIT